MRCCAAREKSLGCAELDFSGSSLFSSCIRRRGQRVDGAQPRVQHTRPYARIHVFEAVGGGDDGGELGVVAVGEELVELLTGPGGGGLGAEIVEDQ